MKSFQKSTNQQGENTLTERDWTPKSEGQREGAEGAAAVLEWRYAISPTYLPKWLHADLSVRGLRVARRIGATTYVSSTWRLERSLT